MTSTLTFDTAALTRAIESRDAAAQLACYRPDAVVTVADQLNPPSRPRVVRGTDELRGYFQDVCDREMVHEVKTTVAAGDRIAYEVACTYPDGARVQCLCVAGLADGKIAWQRQVQVWDS
jgi:ketosteroid isomerase-like protein